MRHSGAGQPRVCNGKQMVVKEKEITVLAMMAVIGGRIKVLRVHGI